MDELITKHSAIMDKYDPEKRVGLIVDEWGTWLSVEKDTNPGFLYQQNTIRDAMVASVTLNIFHKHSDRVHMANIAQMVNVVQSMILTYNEKMVLTPTYHVFDLYKNHHDATLLDVAASTSEFISQTVSKKNDQITVSLCNFNVEGEEVLEILLDDAYTNVKGSIVQGEELDSHNTFENPEVVTTQDFTDYSVDGSVLTVRIPNKSVLSLVLNK